MIVDSQGIALNVADDHGIELDPGVPEIVDLNVGGSLITTTRRCLSNRITTFCLLQCQHPKLRAKPSCNFCTFSMSTILTVFECSFQILMFLQHPDF
jgi:hypothetical protein